MKAVVAVVLTISSFGCPSGLDERIARIHELGRNPTEPNKNRVEEFLHDEDRDVRATVLVVMGSMDPPRAKRIAAGALADRDGLVRAAAVSVLTSEPDAAMVRTLAALAVDDPIWQVRARALEGLANGDREVVGPVFARALVDPVRHVRRAALRAGADHAGLCPTEGLLKIVAEDQDWENRVEAARALGVSGDAAAWAGVDAALGDANEFVRATAAQARRELERAGVARPPAPPPVAEPPKPAPGEKPRPGV